MRESNDTAATSAKAALSQSETNRLASRAYMELEPQSPGVVFSPDGGTIRVRIRATNCGATRAILTNEVTTPLLLDGGAQLPTDPPYGEPTSDIKEMPIYPSKSVDSVRTFAIAGAQQSTIAGTKTLYVIGYLDYIDVFGIRHRCGFATAHDPNGKGSSLFPYVLAGYNYDRERNPKQGTDWTTNAILEYEARTTPPAKRWYWQWPFRWIRAYR